MRKHFIQYVNSRSIWCGLSRTVIAIAQSSEKIGFVTPIVNQYWLLNGFEDAKEFSPNPFLILDGVRPQAVLDG
jgi:hypothetical protein